jgi:hypothetical protein
MRKNMRFRQDGFDVADLFLNTLGHRQFMADRLELSLTVKANPEKRLQFAPYINALQRVRVLRRFIAAMGHHAGQYRTLLERIHLQVPESFGLEKGGQAACWPSAEYVLGILSEHRHCLGAASSHRSEFPRGCPRMLATRCPMETLQRGRDLKGW